ncbi:MAG: hypothetical protein HC903_24370 [Methylacidiphilales bacterium]|nr:hypothetical protein [Candidatus Methylacidiphilales bacterium]
MPIKPLTINYFFRSTYFFRGKPLLFGYIIYSKSVICATNPMSVLIKLTNRLIFEWVYQLDVVKISHHLLDLLDSDRGVICQTRKKPPASEKRVGGVRRLRCIYQLGSSRRN